jgi:hypothetical protein
MRLVGSFRYNDVNPEDGNRRAAAALTAYVSAHNAPIIRGSSNVKGELN